MSNNYAAGLAAFIAALAMIAPSRAITRTLKDLDQHTDAEMQSGLYIVLADSVRSYPYEHSDYVGSLDGPRQTELAPFEFVVIGRGRLAENADGPAIEGAEQAMLTELETLADQAIANAPLQDLALLRSEFSGQLIAPYYAVYTRWRLRLFT